MVYWLRMFNTLLAAGVVGLCFLKAAWDSPNQARNARVTGLGIICLAIALGSFERRHDVFNYRIPMITVGLLFCIYGMRRTAAGEKPRYKN